ncbi:MAG: hypothetical protein ACOX9E_07605 [Lentisphaeria bacterium]|jgi:hypothetical protein
MITLKEALEIATKEEKAWRRLSADAKLPLKIYETSDYWLFNFQTEEESFLPGGGTTAVYKADGSVRYIASGQFPYFYENAVPVQPPT